MSRKYDRKDHFYTKAKEEGLRSRAVYKLDELDKKHKLIKPGMKVLDLGAWPGGWLQYAVTRIGQHGLVVGVDLVEIDDLGDPRILTLKGDVTAESTVEKILSLAGGKFDVVLSDMSPKLSGIKEADHYASIALAEMAVQVAGKVLKKGGNFTCKVFKSHETEVFVKNVRPLFNKVLREELDSTRKSSNEFYVLCLGMK